MRKLVLILAVAMMATNAAGCIISGGDDDGEVVADLGWVFKDLETNTVTGCPAGFDTVRVVAIPVDGNGVRIGSDLEDLLDCVDGVSGDRVSYDPGLYQIFLEIRQGSATGPLYAQSLSELFDLTAADDTFDYTIFNDAGYFTFGWELRAASNNAVVNCQTAEVSQIEIAVSIPENPNEPPRSAKFPCGDGSAVTDGILADDYTASFAAFDGNTVVGGAPAIGRTTINEQNEVTDLGLLVFSITDI
jgi:hypothetical protein